MMSEDEENPRRIGGSAITGWPAVAVTVVASLLVVVLATQSRITGEPGWKIWTVAALLPGLALRWVEIVRRTRWFYAELAASLIAVGVLLWAWRETGERILISLAAVAAAVMVWSVWRRMRIRR